MADGLPPSTRGVLTPETSYRLTQHFNSNEQTSKILQVWFQTTEIKQISHNKTKSHNFFGFTVHIKVIFMLYCSLLSVQ